MGMYLFSSAKVGKVFLTLVESFHNVIQSAFISWELWSSCADLSPLWWNFYFSSHFATTYFSAHFTTSRYYANFLMNVLLFIMILVVLMTYWFSDNIAQAWKCISWGCLLFLLGDSRKQKINQHIFNTYVFYSLFSSNFSQLVSLILFFLSFMALPLHPPCLNVRFPYKLSCFFASITELPRTLFRVWGFIHQFLKYNDIIEY